MPDTEWERVTQYIAFKIERLRAASDLVQEQIQKSRRQIAFSKELLKLPVPKIWHPKPPNSDQHNLCDSNQRPSTAFLQDA